MSVLNSFWQGVVQLFYPHICTGCGSDLLDENNTLCLQCISRLPHTQFERFADNPIEKIFCGRLSVREATSAFYFVRETLIQHLIHQLKYKGNRAIGISLGEMMGNRLLSANRFGQIDVLVPLPLFADKERIRGYNQAALICEGMAQAMQVSVSIGNVVRKRFTETQTKKHRAERWENVADSFSICKPELLAGKNILLVDDVVTTGATLEACGSQLLQIPGVRLSIATLAYAVN